MNNLFWPDENSNEQCFAAHIVDCSRLSTILLNIVTPDCRLIQAQQYRTILLTTLNNVGSKTLFIVVFIRPEQVVHFLLFTTVYDYCTILTLAHIIRYATILHVSTNKADRTTNTVSMSPKTSPPPSTIPAPRSAQRTQG